MQIALFLLNNFNLAFTLTGAQLLSKNAANKKKILIGTVLSFNKNPFHHGLKDSVSISENTAILINVNKRSVNFNAWTHRTTHKNCFNEFSFKPIRS